MVYSFSQSNNFGDTLELLIEAKDENEALNKITDFIITNTTSTHEAYRDQKNYIINCCATDTGPGSYIINGRNLKANEILNYPDDIDEDAKDSAKRTYIWFFEHEPYELINLSTTDKTGILKSTFVYTGK